MISAHRIINELISRVTTVSRNIKITTDKDNVSLKDLCQQLLSEKGEASGLVIATEILQRYQFLDDHEKFEFFTDMEEFFGVDHEKLQLAIDKWMHEGNSAAEEIHFASEPKSQELIRRLNRVNGATRKIVSMRNDLLGHIKKNPKFKSLDKNFRHLLCSWFNRGFLELRRIDWFTGAAILERIIHYEAVHEIKGWDDLRGRVGLPDRRLYAYFHPGMSNDPLIFVEVALLTETPKAVKPILSDTREPIDPYTATTAVFYSISNCQPGLRGISFGNFLIKQAVMELRAEFPEIKTFITLSPIPGFRNWATKECKKEDSILNAEQLNFLADLVKNSSETEKQINHKNNDTDSSLNSIEPLLQSMESTDRKILQEIVAEYLVNAKNTEGETIDPVARFHLGNGARLEHIHANADTSLNGITKSWGTMVNYYYDLKNIEANHETFANEGIVIHSTEVNNLLNKG